MEEWVTGPGIRNGRFKVRGGTDMALGERCPVLKFEDLGDERGKLVVIEGGQSVPFEINRVYL